MFGTNLSPGFAAGPFERPPKRNFWLKLMRTFNRSWPLHLLGPIEWIQLPWIICLAVEMWPGWETSANEKSLKVANFRTTDVNRIEKWKFGSFNELAFHWQWLAPGKNQLPVNQKLFFWLNLDVVHQACNSIIGLHQRLVAARELIPQKFQPQFTLDKKI